MNNVSERVWNACGYVRLSREDGDKEESNSVTGQKDLIRDYLSRHPELRECGMKVDDGFTGSNFDRPGFQEMMSEVKAGKIDCIVVKDLSRFGREHLDAGEYIEKIFPFLGVRFIAINDRFDSLRRNPETDELVIPFKNLVNESYCRDSSLKVRSQLEMKRKRGDFIGSFAVFGYRKDPDNRHKLLVDDYAADVVRDIFRWKLEGLSLTDIADLLNRQGIPTPSEYKQRQGLRYNTPFRVKKTPLWSANMILRILRNPVYIGTLAQGRVTTPTYKVRRTVSKPREEWAVVENCHEAIIDRSQFEVTQRVLDMDTRTCAKGMPVDLFCGVVYCGECGGAMIRKKVPVGVQEYVYYVCATHKNKKTCFSHALRCDDLAEITLELLKKHIQDVIDLGELLDMADAAQLQKARAQKLQRRLDAKMEELKRAQTLANSLYENMVKQLITEDEYHAMRERFAAEIKAAEEGASEIREEMKRELDSSHHEWIDRFRDCRNITELDRYTVVTLIDRILVYRDRRIEIIYRWQDEYQWQLELLTRALSPEKEAD